MQFKADHYNHTRLPKKTKTKELMSKAKLGRKYTPDHKLNMRVSHLLKTCKRNNVDPISHVRNHSIYTDEQKEQIINRIIERGE